MEHELTFDYPWSEAPAWANWAATDLNGQQFWYEKKPETGLWSWIADGDDGRLFKRSVKKGESVKNWKNSLQKRP